jgi:hypothetical protein
LRRLVTIPSETAVTLREMAEEERRTARDQAAVLLTEVIGRRKKSQRRRAPQGEREATRAR